MFLSYYHTNENVLDIILVNCDGGCVHEVQQQAQSLGVKVLEDDSAAVLLQEPRLEHPVEVWRAGAQHQLVRGEVPPVRHQHRVREPALHQIFFVCCQIFSASSTSLLIRSNCSHALLRCWDFMVLEKVFDIGAVTDIFSVHFTFYVLVQNIFYIVRWYDFSSSLFHI